MNNIKSFFLATGVVALLAACGGGNSLESKKAELEKLKAKQTEITAQIASLQEEIASMGDSAATENTRSKIVAVTAVTKQLFMHAVDVQGRVDGDENITYSAKVPAVVKRVNVKAGDRVSAGQVLVELDADVVKAQIETLKKGLELANTVYEKRKSLWEQKVGSEIEFLLP